MEVGEGGGSAGVGWRDGEKRHTTVIEYNKNLKEKKKEKSFHSFTIELGINWGQWRGGGSCMAFMMLT